ncbi:putative ATP-dependent DNA ligase [Aeromonas phage LAh_9]|uniref:DNA ligase n=4 Tax=Lahexavirus TaxID=2843411 RepID=A0A514A0T0_9CAUD|nr:ATP-dependent DNA ligase [Aeromonas phage 4_4572]YP_009847213.1 ATP-dependent DNA ligase [Aeromonas phage LAh_6]YP_009847436.1 ATP-dependent DNA ligase [Aeromonas phage LAh_8]YP_009847605.1 ATP-dependent DNA ligase [Aeromonas phage LAh_9]QDH46498.1 putative ATP-dependent DNA ligase [Aeromonas phage LAh_6]QDH46733.1 putative ATP-dependent DNA ligase [Aeromonas phage LAh_8]QDH46879.1 putative ATP-dependent DNA ligase [Aeromonas phage LAh_9]QEG09050.1 ATP-dependent DNA ligase [Aeromonas phag
MELKTLYGKAKSGKIKEWKVWTDGADVVISHGYIDGKKTIKKIACEAKNVGRSNETSPCEQAIFEAKARWKKQVDKCYRESSEECVDVGQLLPMLAHDYTKVGHRMPYPCHVSPKLDGVRCLCTVTQDDVVFTSRGGKTYAVPTHLWKSLQQLRDSLGVESLLLDGELYIHGMPLQDIISCVKKHNENTFKLEYWVFDIPSEEPWHNRQIDLEAWVGSVALDGYLPGLVVVPNLTANSEEGARSYMDSYLKAGFEGMMLRSPEGMYEYNHRSSGLMKWKDFKECEAEVVDAYEDRIGEGVLTVRLKNGIHFECKMRGTHESRITSEQIKLIGKWITVRFQQYTKDGVPQFPVGICVRAVDEQGNPLE